MKRFTFDSTLQRMHGVGDAPEIEDVAQGSLLISQTLALCFGTLAVISQLPNAISIHSTLIISQPFPSSVPFPLPTSSLFEGPAQTLP